MKATALLGAALLALAGCGGSGGGEESEGAAPTDDPAAAPDTPSTTGNEGDAETEVTTSTSSVPPGPTTTSAPAATTTTLPPVVADARMIEAAVDVRAVAAADFASLADSKPVSVGDIVRTDATGFAEVIYFDGSLSRIDVDTEFEVLELVDEADASTVRTRMGVGRTWHRVQALGESDEFSVETLVASAAVRGTGFAIECLDGDTCTFMVVEGVLEVTLPDGTAIELVAPSAVSVTANGDVSEPTPVPFDGAFGDPWLADNGERDAAEGFDATAVVFETYGPTYGSITGSFSGPLSFTRCEGDCEGVVPPDDSELTRVFDVDCSAGISCRAQTEEVLNQLSDGGTVVESTDVAVPLQFDGTAVQWTAESAFPACDSDNDGDGVVDEVTGEVRLRFDYLLFATEAQVLGDEWVVTKMRGGLTQTIEVVDPGNCPDFGDYTTVSSWEVSRDE